MTKWLRTLLKTWVDEGCMGALNDFHGCPGALYLEILQSLLFLLTHGYIYSTKLHEHNHTGTLYAYHLHVIPCTYIMYNVMYMPKQARRDYDMDQSMLHCVFAWS